MRPQLFIQLWTNNLVRISWPAMFQGTLQFAFDPAGNAVAMIKTNETFQIVDSNNLTGTGTALACDINGDNCVDANLSITITGNRLIAEGASD